MRKEIKEKIGKITADSSASRKIREKNKKYRDEIKKLELRDRLKSKYNSSRGYAP